MLAVKSTLPIAVYNMWRSEDTGALSCFESDIFKGFLFLPLTIHALMHGGGGNWAWVPLSAHVQVFRNSSTARCGCFVGMMLKLTTNKQPHNRKPTSTKAMMFFVMNMHKQVSGFCDSAEKPATCTDSGTQAQFSPLPLNKKNRAWVHRDTSLPEYWDSIW